MADSAPPPEPPPAKPPQIQLPLVKRRHILSMKPDQSKMAYHFQPYKQICFVPTGGYSCDTQEECVREVREIQKRNMHFLNWPDVPYNYLIGGDGFIYEGRGFETKLKDFGDPAFSEVFQVGYVGDFKEEDPPKHMVDLGMLLIAYGQEKKYIAEDYEYIECPLNQYYQFCKSREEFYESEWFKDFMSRRPPPPPPRPPKQ